RSLAVILPVVIVVLTALVWWLAGRALRPVEVMRADVQRMSGGDHHARVTEPATKDEIGRLARTMNSLLQRIETSSERQREFVGDASHELRSPLARLRTEL